MHQTAYNSGVTAMNSFQFHDSGLSTANFTESYCYNPEYWSTAGVGGMPATGYGVPPLNPMKQIEGLLYNIRRVGSFYILEVMGLCFRREFLVGYGN